MSISSIFNRVNSLGRDDIKINITYFCQQANFYVFLYWKTLTVNFKKWHAKIVLHR